MAVEPFTYDITTQRGQVRLLAIDNFAADATFNDNEIDSFLTLTGHVLLAAALALDTQAANAAIVQGWTKFEDVHLDGTKVAIALHDQAMQLRKQCYEGDDGTGASPFTWAEWVTDPFAYRDRLVNSMLRQST